MENDFQERKSWTGIVYIHPRSAVMFLHVGAFTLILVIPVQSWTVHFSFFLFHVCSSLCSEKHDSHIFGVSTTCSAPVCNGWLCLVDQHSHVDSAFQWAPSLPSALLCWAAPPTLPPSQALSGMLGHCLLVILIPALPHFPQSSSHSRVLGWIFKEERKKKGRKTLLFSNLLFDSFLKIHYTLLQCPPKILLCGRHSTAQFH